MGSRARALVVGCALAIGCARAPTARERAAADADYRRGIALLAAGKPAAAREALRAAAARAPIDPPLYLPLARACRDRGLAERAAGFYRKFLAATPAGPDADAARAELAALGDDVAPLLDEAPAARPWPSSAPFVAMALALAASAALLAARRRGARSQTLAQLASANPELQPAINFLVASLRHELLKHRLLTAGDQSGERQFLLARLYGGEPLPVAWAGHLGAFMRALGPRFDLVRHDPSFRDADRAITDIAALERALRRDDARAWDELARAQGRLAALDRMLAALTTRLQNAVLDAALLHEVADAAQRELGACATAVALTVAAPPPDVAVEMYRLDLVLVLKNLLRNAIAAAAVGPAPHRVAVDVRVEVEPTGEEIVRIAVRDTNPAAPRVTAPAGRGLGLVTTALARSDGALTVEDGGDGWAKAVVVRLFRVLAAASEAA